MRRSEREGWLIRKAEQVIDDCHLSASVELWFREFDSVVERLAAWCRERSDRIEACYLSSRGSGVRFFLVASSPTFDLELAEQSAEMTRDLPSTHNVGSVEILQIPSREAARFLNVRADRRIFPHDDPS